MFYLKKPLEAEIDRVLSDQSRLAFTYEDVGASVSGSPENLAKHYLVIHDRVCLGCGGELYHRAQKAMEQWAMFRSDWVEVYPLKTDISPGVTVSVLAKVLFVWALNASRILYRIDEAGPVERFGFAYGTLPEHGAIGEERFLVEWRHADDRVWFDVFSFSRPRHWLIRLLFPYLRFIQRKFVREAMNAFLEAVRDDTDRRPSKDSPSCKATACDDRFSQPYGR